MKRAKTPLQPFIDVYLRNHVAQLAAGAQMAGTIRKYFGPLLTTPLEAMTPLQIEEWFHGIGASSPSMANKALSILRTMFEKAKDWRQFSGENPCGRIKKYKGRARNRFIQPGEMPRLMEVLQREPEEIQCYFLLCLLLGCRRTEGLSMRWIDLDFVNALWHKQHTKTDRAQTVPIPRALLKRIQCLRGNSDSEYVFPAFGRRPLLERSGHLSTSFLFLRWKRIRTAAGLPDVTIHDLRRTTASWLACHGENLAIIGNVLNHSGLSHTAVYARLNISPVTRALEENSVRMLPTAPPVPSQTMRPLPPASDAEREEWPG